MNKDVQTIVQEDAPWVFVANWKQNAVTSDRVAGFSLQPSFFLLLDDVVKKTSVIQVAARLWRRKGGKPNCSIR